MADAAFVPTRDASSFGLIVCFRQWLSQACGTLRIPQPVYECEFESGSFLCHVKMQGRNVPSGRCRVYGRRSPNKNAALEDAAYQALDYLLSANGLNVLDFNFERLVAMQERVNTLEVENFDLQLSLAMVKQELAALRSSVPGPQPEASTGRDSTAGEGATGETG